MADELKAALPTAWRPAVDDLDPVAVVILYARIPKTAEQVRMVAIDAAEQALATILADYAITTRTWQPRRVQPGEVISRLRMENDSGRLNCEGCG